MDSPSPMLYLAIVLLLVCSALFSATETAISTVSKLHIKKFAEKGSKKAGRVLGILGQYDKALYTILVGNNVVNIASSTIATVIFTAWFGGSGAAIATVVMTVLVLTFGEILPKSYGKDHNEKVALNLSGLLRVVMMVLTPVTWVFTKLRNSISPAPEAAPSVTEEDLHYLIESVEEEGVIEEHERDLVKSALEFDDTDIKDILTPRVNMVSIDIEDDADEIKRIIIDEGYSRIPVYEENIDNIVGILYARDYLKNIVEGRENNLRDMLSKPFFVHRTMTLSGLLTFFKSKKTNIAVVTDDYGGTLGLVTTEDIIEELVGDLWDEEEDEEPVAFIRVDDTRYEVFGAYALRDLAEEDGWEDYDFSDDYSTVNGWAMQIFGHIPEVGETAVTGDLVLKVLQMDANRIDILEISRPVSTPDARPDNDTDTEGNDKDKEITE